MLLGPVKQRKLQLRHPLVHIGIIAALAHLLCHIGANLRDTGVIGMGLVGHQQIQFRVLLDLHTDFIQSLNGCIACEEILRSRAEGNDFQLGQADQGTGNRLKFTDHLCDLGAGAHRILRDKGFQMAHTQVVRAVQHTAVGVSTAVDQVAVALGGSHIHTGAVKVSGNQCFRRLRAEIAQENHQGVAAGLFHIRNCRKHILFIFHRGLALIDVKPLLLAGSGHSRPAAFRQGNDKTVPGHGDQSQFYFGNISKHTKILLLF